MPMDRLINWDDFGPIEDKLITEEIGENIIRPEGSHILVRVYAPEAYRNAETMSDVPGYVKIGGLLVSQKEIESSSYNNRCGRVLAFGPRAFHGSAFHPSEPRFKHGDWIQFQRYRIAYSPIKGILLGYLRDLDVLGTVQNPDQLNENPMIGK
jgi:co-chaperonin GroES (HSP10)